MLFSCPVLGRRRKTIQLKQKQISDLAFDLIFHRFLPCNCCLSAVLYSDKGDYPEHYFADCVFVVINGFKKKTKKTFICLDQMSKSRRIIVIQLTTNWISFLLHWTGERLKISYIQVTSKTQTLCSRTKSLELVRKWTLSVFLGARHLAQQ